MSQTPQPRLAGGSFVVPKTTTEKVPQKIFTNQLAPVEKPCIVNVMTQTRSQMAGAR